MESISRKTSTLIASIVLANTMLAGAASAQRPNNYITLGQKRIPLKTVSPITVPTVNHLKNKDSYQLPVDLVLTLPKLMADPSPMSPKITPVVVPVRLPPLVRFSIKPTWAKSENTLAQESTPSTLKTVVEPQTIPVESFSEGEFKILEALLLLKSENTTPLSIGLANPLLQMSATKAAGDEIIARSLLRLKIRTAATEHLNDLARSESNPSKSQLGAKLILSNLKTTDYEEADFLLPILEKLKVPEPEWGNLPIAIARESLHARNLEKAWQILSRVPTQNSQSYEARFLRSMIQYRSNQVLEAQKGLESLVRDFDKAPKDLRSLIASTIAQIYFQKGDYKKAYAMYRRVNQDHPLWMQTLVETAWSQILNKDFEGAAGNMFSLHTNYFKGAYNPESYIVRTVGYLQLCQYGDALSVLQDFLKKYKFAQKQLASYKKNKPNHLETVRDFLKAGMPKKFAGLPRSLLVEIARDPQFIELQKKLNEIEEDSSKLSQLSTRLVELDKEFIVEQGQINLAFKDLDNEIKKAASPEKRASLVADRLKKEKQLQRLSVLRRIIIDAKQGVANEHERFANFWINQKGALKLKQADVISSSFQTLEADLAHWLDQSELLFYEIHNGAGEHLRYQMASTDESKALGKKPGVFKKGEKHQLWAFDGEIWEDEVGHYRSSLKNVCPVEDTKTTYNQDSKHQATFALAIEN